MAMSSIDKFNLGGGLGSLGAGIGSLFFGGGNPYKGASKTLDQIGPMAGQYYSPYINAGAHVALPQLLDQFKGLINDPNALISKIGGGYQKSPGYDWQLNQGMQAANNAAAAGGLAGSPQHQQQAATMAEGLANQDYYNYLQHALGLYGTGLQGMSGLNQMGFNSSDQMANLLSNLMGQKAQMQFAGDAAQNQQKGSAWGNILGGLGKVGGVLFGL